MPICARSTISTASFGRDIPYSAKPAATWLTINRLC